MPLLEMGEFDASSPWLYLGRAASRHRNHGPVDWLALARRAENPGCGEPLELQEQSQADWPGHAKLPRHNRFLSGWLLRSDSLAAARQRPRLGLGGLPVTVPGTRESLSPD